jgi:hypothetical protein
MTAISGLSRTATHSISTFLPGHYRIVPESFGRDINQDRNVDLTPGQQLYAKIVSLGSWGVSLSGFKNMARDTFYAWLIPPQVAQAEIARDRTGI